MRMDSFDKEKRLVLEDPKGLRTYFYLSLTSGNMFPGSSSKMAPRECDQTFWLQISGSNTPPGDRDLDLTSYNFFHISNNPDGRRKSACCDERFTLGQDWTDGRIFFNSGFFSSIAEANHHEGTPGHSRFVAVYSVLLAGALGIRDVRALRAIERGALLHDIGKMGVPEAILNKVGPLTAVEREIIRDHPVIGYKMIEEFGFLKEAAEIVLCHHERFDGRGYPRGLAGDEVPLGARIFALADTLDAITSDRPYRRGKSFEAAFQEIERSSGSQFDPRIVDGFLSVPRRTWERAKAETWGLVRPASVL